MLLRELGAAFRDRWIEHLALAWAVAFGGLYVRTVLLARAPGLWSRIAEWAGIGGS